MGVGDQEVFWPRPGNFVGRGPGTGLAPEKLACHSILVDRLTIFEPIGESFLKKWAGLDEELACYRKSKCVSLS